jgi:uncharacterized membrane protein
MFATRNPWATKSETSRPVYESVPPQTKSEFVPQTSVFAAPKPTQQTSASRPTQQTNVFGVTRPTSETSVFAAPKPPSQTSAFGVTKPTSDTSVFAAPKPTQQTAAFGVTRPTQQTNVFGVTRPTSDRSVFAPTQQTAAFGVTKPESSQWGAPKPSLEVKPLGTPTPTPQTAPNALVPGSQQPFLDNATQIWWIRDPQNRPLYYDDKTNYWYYVEQPSPQPTPQPQYIVPPYNNPQPQQCKQDALFETIKAQLNSCIARQDWETMLILSNTILSWKENASPDLKQMAEAAIKFCNSRGFTTELIFANLKEFAEHGPTDVKLIRTQIEKRKLADKRDNNREITRYERSAMSMLEKLKQETKEPDLITEFEGKFFLSAESKPQIANLRKTPAYILKTAVKLQTENEQRLVDQLTAEAQKSSEPWLVFGLSQKLNDALVKVYGSLEAFVHHYVGSNLFIVLIGTMVFKFAVTFLCKALAKGASATIASWAAGIVTGYQAAFLGAIFPIVFFGIIFNVAFGLTGYIAMGALEKTFAASFSMVHFFKSLWRWLSFGGVLYQLASVTKMAIGLICDFTINKIPGLSLTPYGISACDSNYDEFVHTVMFPSFRTAAQALLYNMCHAFYVVSGWKVAGGFPGTDLCALYNDLASTAAAIMHPPMTPAQLGDYIPPSDAIQTTFVDLIYGIWSKGWNVSFGFPNGDFMGFAEWWAARVPWSEIMLTKLKSKAGIS